MAQETRQIANRASVVDALRKASKALKEATGAVKDALALQKVVDRYVLNVLILLTKNMQEDTRQLRRNHATDR